ncbi:DUF1297 domain-containing protein [Candidatus Gracilibacteria bacterium]|nr:DUF1297 domain-containing protein [Candidatus Gracilibacteria bacterium]
MISHQHILEILQKYDQENLTIGVLGGHTALDVCHGAKKYGFKTVVICQKGREKTYDRYFRVKPDVDVVPGQLEPWHNTKGIIDETIIVDKFADIVKPKIQEQLREMNTIMIHNRYFWVYCDFNQIENDFLVPIYGTREMLRLEDRSLENNQYSLLRKAGIRYPKIFERPRDIDRLVLVKVNETLRGYERASFFASSPQDYEKKARELIKAKIISEKNLQKAVIEEFIIGAPLNFNFFYSNMDNELELMGCSRNIQTNMDGLLRLPAPEQSAILQYMRPRMIVAGHDAVTVKESLVEKIFLNGEKFVEMTRTEFPPGIIGPFALQGAITAEDGYEDLVIYDVSMRIPGAPGLRYTPYSGYLYGDSLSVGERIAMEIKKAIKERKLTEIVT